MRKPPALRPGARMVEAAGQLVCLFRDRLDYAFTPAPSPGAERVIRSLAYSSPDSRKGGKAPNPSAGSAAVSSAGL
jgi:hypothetical protein